MKPGTVGWLLVAGFIAGLDAYLVRKGYDSLSTVFGDALDKRGWKWIPIIVWTYITVHLCANLICKFLPLEPYRKYDPLGAIAKKITREAYEKITIAEEAISQIIEAVTVED